MKTLRTSYGSALLAAMVLMAVPVAATQNSTHIAYAQFPPGAIAVVAQVRAKPGKEDELRAVTLPLIALVRNEPNNLVYFLQEDQNVPGHFVFYEVFASEADFEAHNATPHVKAWFGKLSDLAQGGVEVTRMRILQQSRR